MSDLGKAGNLTASQRLSFDSVLFSFLDSSMLSPPSNGTGIANYATPDPPVRDHETIQMDPLARFYSDDDGPWVPHRRSGLSDSIDNSSGVAISTSTEDGQFAFGPYRIPPASEIESVGTGPFQSDSGYATKSLTTRSILSGDAADGDQDSSITGHLTSWKPFLPPEMPPEPTDAPTDQQTFFSPAHDEVEYDDLENSDSTVPVYSFCNKEKSRVK